MEDLMKFAPITDIIVSEGTVLGARYYTAEPVGGNWEEMSAWCTQSFGEPAEVWNIGNSEEYIWPDCGRWYMNSRRFWFRSEKDRDWFIIRWRA
jgi:hypothetical protein